ncbi:MAG: phytanoyl-CoA dioxygenase family protein [Nitratireductor sp.]
MIASQHETNRRRRSHFAKPGANDRVWNTHCRSTARRARKPSRYYASPAIALASLAWLGPDYQMTAQVNRVNPGGAAQSAHHDYHLGFMSTDRGSLPASCHEISPFMTLQGAVADCDMRSKAGPTLFLPYSQNFSHGYVLFETAGSGALQPSPCAIAARNGRCGVLQPALMHAAGSTAPPISTGWQTCCRCRQPLARRWKR